MPSIQPTQRASSTDSGQVTLGLPEPFLKNPTHSSLFVVWCFSNHFRRRDGDEKKTTLILARAPGPSSLAPWDRSSPTSGLETDHSPTRSRRETAFRRRTDRRS